MEKLTETIKLKEFRPEGKLPHLLADLPKNSKDMVQDIEKFYFDLATRVNWLIDRAKGFYGEIYVEGIDFDIALAAEDTYYQVEAWSNGGSDAANGEYRGAAPDITNDHLPISKAGKYFVRWHVAAYSGQKNEYEFEVFKNNGATGFPQTENYRTTSTASAVGACSGGGICDLSVGDTVELWVERKDGAAVSKTITIRAAVLSYIRIGEPD